MEKLCCSIKKEKYCNDCCCVAANCSLALVFNPSLQRKLSLGCILAWYFESYKYYSVFFPFCYCLRSSICLFFGLWSSDCPGAFSVDKAGLEPTEICLSLPVAEIRECAIMPDLFIYVYGCSVCLCVWLCATVCLYIVCALYPHRGQKRAPDTWNWSCRCCESPCGCWVWTRMFWKSSHWAIFLAP